MKSSRGHFATSSSEFAPPLTTLLATVAAALSLSGCAPEADCEDFGCDPGLVCDQSSGECVEPSRNCPETPCEEGFFCHRPSGECRPRARSCSTDADCLGDRRCNDDGICELPDVCSEEDCTEVETCDPETGNCVPKSCSNQPDCSPEGFICGNEGRCVSGCLLGEGSCPTGQSCREVPGRGAIDGIPVGECRSRCRNDSDCPCGSACASETCGPPSSCNDDADCGSDDEVCRDGKCTCAPCTFDDIDCPGNQVCDRPTGICLSGECTEDRFSPNHVPANSAEIAVGRGTELEEAELQLCPGRSDWFELPVESAQTVELNLVHAVSRDLDLVVYDERDRVVASDQLAPPRRAGAGGRFSSRTTVISDREQSLQIRVYSARRRSSGTEGTAPLPEGASYDLEIRRPRGESCRDREDDNEENDRRSEAESLPSNVGAESTLDLQICNGDLDWFVLPDVPARSRLQARLTRVAPEDDHLRLTILSPGGRSFTLNPSQALNLLRTGPEQNWYMLAYSEKRRSATYGIRYSIAPPYECRRAGRHGTVENALPLTPRVETENFLCPLAEQWEVDWIRLESPQSNARLEFDLTPVPPDALPPLAVTLFERRQMGLERLRPAASDGSALALRAEVDPSQELFVRVGRRETENPSDRRPGILEVEPRYETFYRYVNP